MGVGAEGERRSWLPAGWAGAAGWGLGQRGRNLNPKLHSGSYGSVLSGSQGFRNRYKPWALGTGPELPPWRLAVAPIPSGHPTANQHGC